MRKTTSPWIDVRNSPIHGTGVFAKKDIPEGTRIIEYVGERITKKQTDERADEQMEKHEQNHDEGAVYIFELNKRYDIDGNVPWNTAKYINHGCDPNCEVDIIRGKIWISSIKDIKKGEELQYDYGFDVDDYESHPCKCGAKNCVGYIVAEEDWPKLKRRLQAKKNKRKAAANRAKKRSSSKT